MRRRPVCGSDPVYTKDEANRGHHQAARKVKLDGRRAGQPVVGVDLRRPEQKFTDADFGLNLEGLTASVNLTSLLEGDPMRDWNT